MADNVAVTPGSGATFAADDISSVLYPRVKISLGADGSAVDAIAGAGNVSTAVQRVTLATDDAVGSAIVTAINNAASPTVNVTPTTSGGLSRHRSIDLDESHEEVKGSAGQVYSMWVANLATSTRFIKFYDAATAGVTVGTTTPYLTIPIPGNSSDDIAGVFNAGSHGIVFATGICVAATTGVADADTGAPGANEVIVNIFYK
jgi:hypothetical protein